MRTTQRIDVSAVLINTAFFVALMAIAALSLWPIYQSGHFVIVAAVTIVVGCGIALAGALRRWSSPIILGALVVAYLALGVPLAVPDQAIAGVLPSGRGFIDLVTGSALSWKQLVTVDLPVETYQALLVPAFILLLVGGVVGLSVALRAQRGELGILAPITIVVVGIVLGPAEAVRPLVIAISFLLVSLFWMIWRASYRRRLAVAVLTGAGAGRVGSATSVATRARGVVRQSISAVVVLAIALGAGIAASAWLAPDADRAVVRTAITRPFDPRDYASPLSGFRSFWQPATADTSLFTVTGLPNGSRIGIATMDTYNGVVYTVGSSAVNSASGSFARVPASIPRDGGTAIDYSVEITGLSGVWLPLAGDLESIEFTGTGATVLGDSFYFNKNTGNGAVIGGLATGDGYTVHAVVPDVPTDEELSSVSPGPAEVPTPTNVPDELIAAVDDYTAGLDAPGEKLLAVIDAIRSTGYISHGVDPEIPFSRSGHSADRLIRLLTESPMLGDGEQYATAVALMANQIGFPARVVMGFIPESGTSDVTGSDVSAWVEVNTAGSGWVPLTATPDDRVIPEKLPEETEQISRPQVVVPPPPPPEDALVEPQRTAEDDNPKDEPNPFWAILFEVLKIVGISALIVAILLSPVITILALKASRRKRRRRADTPRGSISGGWDELVDTATDYGYRIPTGATRSEFVTAVGQQDMSPLATVADEAVFGAATVANGAAEEYWRDLESLKKSWAKDYTRWERLKASLAVRSLARYHSKKPQRGGHN